MTLRLPTLNECAYGLLAILVAVTILLLGRLDQYNDITQQQAASNFLNQIEAAAVTTEENALKIPAYVFAETEQVRTAPGPGLAIAILLDPINYSNGLATDIQKLNYLHLYPPGNIRSVQGYYVSDQHDLFGQFLSIHKIRFPVVKSNPLTGYQDSLSTPLVLVLDAQSGMILDTHQPIPDDVQKSTFFYDRWGRLMNRYAFAP